MKAVIPVKLGSTRIPNKNFRQFTPDGESLFDITLKKLLKLFHPNDITITAEGQNDAIADAVGRGCAFLQRPKSLVDNDCPMTKVIEWVGDHLNDDFAWCQVCNPTFDEYGPALEQWAREKQDPAVDGLVVVSPFKDYLLDANYRPLGFGFGAWHVPSQTLPQMYRFPFVLSILRYGARRHGHVPPNAAFYHWKKTPYTDIDDWQEFTAASAIYERLTSEGIL